MSSDRLDSYHPPVNTQSQSRPDQTVNHAANIFSFCAVSGWATKQTRNLCGGEKQRAWGAAQRHTCTGKHWQEVSSVWLRTCFILKSEHVYIKNSEDSVWIISLCADVRLKDDQIYNVSCLCCRKLKQLWSRSEIRGESWRENTETRWDQRTGTPVWQ